LAPILVDHPLKLATDHCLDKLILHQLANQTQAPPYANSSFHVRRYRAWVPLIVVHHPLKRATDHRLDKLLLHQLANQIRAPP